MKYEDKYERCFDCLFFDIGGGDAGLITLLEEYGVEVVDKNKFEEKVKPILFEMLEKCHEEGIIRPINKKGDSRWEVKIKAKKN